MHPDEHLGAFWRDGLALWRRVDLAAPDTFEVFGDVEVARRLLARTDLG